MIFNRLAEIGFKPQIAVGHDADHAAARIDNGQPGNLVLVRQREHVAHFHVLRNGDRVFDDAAFKAFDLRYLRGLCAGSHVLVNYPDSAFLRDGNRQARFGYRVHRGGQQRNIETDGTREPGGQAYIAGQDGGVGRNQQNIVEGQGFLDHSHLAFPRKSALYAKRRKPPSKPGR